MSRKRTPFSDEQKRELQRAYDSCRDGKSKIRYQALLLYASGRGVDDIQAITGCSRTSLMEWRRSFLEQGAAGLRDGRRGGNRARLSAAQIGELTQQLHSYQPHELLGASQCHISPQFWTVAELATLLERDYGVVYASATSYRTLLRRCKMSRQRPATRYRSRSEAAVAEFEEALEKN